MTLLSANIINYHKNRPTFCLNQDFSNCR